MEPRTPRLSQALPAHAVGASAVSRNRCQGKMGKVSIISLGYRANSAGFVIMTRNNMGAGGFGKRLALPLIVSNSVETRWIPFTCAAAGRLGERVGTLIQGG